MRKIAATFVCFLVFTVSACGGTGNTIPIPGSEDFSAMTWTKAFEAFHDKYSREYAFTEWKGIDWAALNAQYLPQIVEAEFKNDAAAYQTAVRGYVLSVPDGHIMVSSAGMTAIMNERTGGGFGLCITGLDDGRVIADLILAGGPAAAAGMLAGAEITEWNGLAIATALSQVDLLWRQARSPIATDERARIEQFRYLVRAPVGTEATVVFRNDGAPASQTAVLTAVNDDYATLVQADFAAGADMSVPISFEILPSGYGYMKVTVEYSDQAAYDGFKQAVQYFVDANVPGVIVDLRGNHGGDDDMAARYSGFFHEETSFYEYQNYIEALTWQFEIGLEDTSGVVTRGGSLSIVPQEPHYGGPVVALVNPGTISSGEGVAMGIARAPRGQVIGFYGTDGSFGMVTGDGAKLPEGIEIGFPSGQSLDENMIVQLDSQNGVGGVAPTVRIPLTQERAIAFANGEDVELAFAIDWLEAN